MAPKTLLQLKRQKEHEKLAAASADAGKSAAAIEAAQLAKKSYSGGKAGKVDALKEEANESFRNQDYPRALELYNQAILLDGKNAVLHSNRSAVYCALRNFPLALKDADSCIRLAPTYGRGHFRRGYALEQQWRYAEAYDAYAYGLKVETGSARDELLAGAFADLKQLLAELKMTEQSANAAKAASAAAAKQKEAESGADTKTPLPPAAAVFDAKSTLPVPPSPVMVTSAKAKSGAGEVDRFDQMTKWLKDGGAKFPKLYLQYYDEDYRGVHTLTKINNDEIVVYIPQAFIMTSEVARESEICRKMDNSGVDLRSKHSYLAAFLLQEKAKAESHWHPYIRILPEKYANVPIYFDAAKRRWLKGSMCLAKIDERNESLRVEYQLIADKVPAFAKFTLAEFVWARLVVITRIFGLVINGVKTDGLVPYADMLNHKRPRETKWAYEDSYGGFLITSLKTIHRGDQVYDSYGRKCNSRFFVNYGFALDENEDNEAIMVLSVNEQDICYAAKMTLLNTTNPNKEWQVPAVYHNETKTKEMFSFLRLAHATRSEFDQINQRIVGKEQLKIDAIDVISPTNEIACLTSLRDAALYALSLFDTTLEADNKLLASDSADLKDSNIRNCVVVRRGEKEVLHWYVALADRCIPYLNLSYSNLLSAAGSCVKASTPAEEYIMTVVFPIVKKFY